MTQEINDLATWPVTDGAVGATVYKQQFRDPKDVLRETERMKKRLAEKPPHEGHKRGWR
jgi:hypothetical protein